MLAQMTPRTIPMMRPSNLRILSLALLLGLASIFAYLGTHAPNPIAQSITTPDLSKLPLSFEPNVGQTNSEAMYMSRASGGTFYFSSSAVVLALKSAEDKAGILKTTFVGANSNVAVKATTETEGKANYLLGNDPSGWHTNVPTFAGITYAQVYNGIDLTYSGTEGRLKSTYTVAPGADPASIRLHYENISSINVDPTGNLQLSLLDSAGKKLTVTEAAPVAWQTVGGKVVPVTVHFNISLDDSIVGFAVGSYDKSLPLIIDPTLVYSTYLGGLQSDGARGIYVDNLGNQYIAGFTASSSFPISNALQPDYGGGTFDAYVSKINPTGTGFIYSTFLGSSGDDRVSKLQVNSLGEVYLAGRTNSTTFPTLNPIQASFGGGSSDGFVAKLNATGSALVFSTYLGGDGQDEPSDLELDYSGNIFIDGITQSSNYPTVNAYQATLNGIQDAFLTKISSQGTNISYSTYFGGSAADTGYGLAVDSAGNAYISGYTLSQDIPVQNAIQATFGGGEGDAYVTKFSVAGTSLVFSTYLGGSGNDVGENCSVDSTGRLYVTGYTSSTNFPTHTPIQATNHGSDDVFFARLSSNGSALEYSTYYGGSLSDIGSSPKFDAEGNLYLIGYTESTNFPTLNPVQATNAGGIDAFIIKADPAGSAILYATYLGGSNTDYGIDLAVDNNFSVYAMGDTISSDFPLVSSLRSYGGDQDAFLSKIYELTVTPTNTSTPTATPTDTPTNTPTDTATPTITPTASPTVCVIEFEDVPPGSTFYTYVRCLACLGIINGYPCGNPEPCVPPTDKPYYRPSSNITRGQLAKVIAVSADFQDPVSGQSFQDIEAGSTFWLWAERLVIHEVLSGYPCGGEDEPCVPPDNRPYFRPNNMATRGQLAKIVSNASGFSEPVTGQTFEDVPPGATFYEFIQRLVNRNVISGYPCGSPEPCVPPANKPYYRPNSHVTRGQTSKIVSNTFFPGCSIR